MSMLYRAPGPHLCDGHMVDYIVVDDSQDEATVKQGWYRTIPEALSALQPPEEHKPAAEVVEPKRRGRRKVAGDVDQA